MGELLTYKYFDFTSTTAIEVEFSGKCQGKLCLSHAPDFQSTVAEIAVGSDGARKSVRAAMAPEKSVRPLYIRFEGNGSLNLHAFTLE